MTPEERVMLLEASEVSDAMWYARYHGGQNGRAASQRWGDLRRVANNLHKWRQEQQYRPTAARLAEAETERRAKRLAATRREVE